MITGGRKRNGTDRLLAAVARLGRACTPGRRLEAELGDDLARLLVVALSGAHGLRARGLRGRSSP